MSDALIGVIIGGSIAFISGFIIENFKQKKEKIKFKREKIEKVCFEYSSWSSVLNSFYNITQHYLELETNPKKAYLIIAKTNQSKKLSEIDENKTSVLLSLYFPELVVAYNKLVIQSGNIANDLTEEKLEDLNLEKFKAKLEDFRLACISFKNDIVSISNKIERC